MSDASSAGNAAQQRAQAYLRAMYQLNPVWQSRQILQLRRRTLKLPSALPAVAETATVNELADHDKRERMRQRGRNQLKHLQENFYELSAEQLERGLDELTPERVPDLAPVVARLRVAAQHREILVSLFHQPAIDDDLIQTLGWVLVSRPSDAGFAREKYIQSLTTKKKVREARVTAEYLAQHFPDLFHLERDWLTTIASQTRPSAGTLGESSWKLDLGTSQTVIFVVVIGILIRVIAAFLRN